MNWKKLNINALEDDTQYLFHHKYEKDEIMKYDVMTFSKRLDGYELWGEFNSFRNSYRYFKGNKEDCPYDYYIEIPQERLKNNRTLISPEKRLPQDGEIVVGIIEASIYYGNKKNIQVFKCFKNKTKSIMHPNFLFSNQTITYFPEQLRWWFRFPLFDVNYVIQTALKKVKHESVR